MEKSASVVITSQREPSQRLQSALSLKDENLLRVPALTEDEIIALLGDFGFSGGKGTELQYAKIIYLQTSGHPQLVLATIGNLSNAGWPSLNVEALLNTPEGVLEAKRDTLQILVNKLSLSQRTVIYRLGIDPETSPAEMFNAHGFILNLIRTSVLGREAADSAAKLVSDNWLRVLQYPVQLRLPRSTVPPLKSACESTKTGVQKIADILIAASDAISMRVPSTIIDELKGIRG